MRMLLKVTQTKMAASSLLTKFSPASKAVIQLFQVSNSMDIVYVNVHQLSVVVVAVVVVEYILFAIFILLII